MFSFYSYIEAVIIASKSLLEIDECFICSLILAQYSPFNTNFLLHSQWNCTKSGSILFYELFHCPNTLLSFQPSYIFCKKAPTTKNANKLFLDLSNCSVETMLLSNYQDWPLMVTWITAMSMYVSHKKYMKLLTFIRKRKFSKKCNKKGLAILYQLSLFFWFKLSNKLQ